ncbi:MAG: ribbon-helix-helix protein, CopG family [Lentisphaerae bacterium]|nr:ribbon-helix-helix protein, CopG family [Lentisphaerota bacterium]
MFGPSVRLDKALAERLEQAAAARGYATMHEFVRHVLEEAVRDSEETQSEDEVRHRLKGLGYLE